METKEVISYLTNGIGEKPYFRITSEGEVHIFVADKQLFCVIPKYDDNENYTKKVAEAICLAGELLQKAENFKATYAKEIQEHDKELRDNINGGLKRAY